MNVLVFTGLFPNNMWPNHGIFIHQRVNQVAKRSDWSMCVVAPVPYYPPIPFGWRKRYREVETEQQLDGITVYHPRYVMIPKVGMALQGFLLFLSMLSVIRKINQTRTFDVIDAHYVYPDGFAAVLLGWWFKIPVVVSARGSDVNLFKNFSVIRRIIRWTLYKADSVVTVSRALKDVTVSLGIPAEKIAVIANGVDTEKFFPLAKCQARKELGLSVGERQVILSVGHLTPNKGFDLLIKALKILSDKSGKDCPLLLIIGGGEYQRVLEQLTESLGVQSLVTFVGSKPHHALCEYYNAADVLCLMSEREGHPNVILESLACGRPVVATDVGGIPEILSSNLVGMLVKRDVQQLAETLPQALRQEWDVEAIVAHAKKFSWAETAQSVQYVLQSVVSSSPDSETTLVDG